MSRTATICTFTMVLLACYDLVAIYFGGVDASISRWMQESGAASPFLILVVGYLLGHFFGNMRPRKQ